MPLPHMVPRFDGTEQFPRRNCVDQYTPEEAAIWKAHAMVEALPASVHLTDAVVALAKAAGHVADYLEGLPPSETAQPTLTASSECPLCGNDTPHYHSPEWAAARAKIHKVIGENWSEVMWNADGTSLREDDIDLARRFLKMMHVRILDLTVVPRAHPPSETAQEEQPT